MSFHVVWAPIAEDRLAELWLASDDRQQITEAANRIDELLAASPTGVGESRAGALRVMIESPLTVYYTVDEDGRLVTVKSIWKRS